MSMCTHTHTHTHTHTQTQTQTKGAYLIGLLLLLQELKSDKEINTLHDTTNSSMQATTSAGKSSV
jgi:hypothetical protein